MTDAQSGPSGGGMPLLGKRVWITRSPERAAPMATALRALGAEVIVAATTAIVDVSETERDELVDALCSPDRYDWILFSSANAVRACEHYLQRIGKASSVLRGLQVAAMGEATGAALAEVGLRATLQAGKGTGEDLAHDILLAAGPTPPRVLYPRAREGRQEPLDVLSAAGCTLSAHSAYASVAVSKDDPAFVAAQSALQEGTLHGIAFFAPSQARALLAIEPGALATLGKLEVIAAIGSTTAAELEGAGLHVHAVASTPNTEDIVDKILQAFS